MSTLSEKANTLRGQLPKTGGATPPQMKGVLLGKLPHRDGEIRLSWDEFEGHHFLSIRLWASDESGNFPHGDSTRDTSIIRFTKLAQDAGAEL